MSTTIAFSFADIGRRIRVVGDQRHEADLRSNDLPEDSPEYKSCMVTMDCLLEEEFALHDLVLSMTPKTLKDAAVQLGALFSDLITMTNCELSSKDLASGIRRAKRVTAGIARAVAAAADVDLSQFSELDTVSLMDSICPPEPEEQDYEGAKADRVRW